MADLVWATPASAVYLDDLTRPRGQLAGTGGIGQSQSLYLDPTTGTVLPTTAATSGKFAFRGIAVNLPSGGASKGSPVAVVESGFVAGLDLSALNYDALVYLSDTAGTLSSSAGTNSVVVGRVVAMTDKDPVAFTPSKILYVRPSSI